MVSTVQPLSLVKRNRDFRRLWLAQVMVAGAYWFVQIPLLVLLNELTGSGFWGALTLAVDTGVTAALLPLAGTIADRVDRRKIMMVANVIGIMAVLPLFAVRSAELAWLAIVVVTVLAAATAFYIPSAAAALPNLVAPADLVAANAIAGSAFGTMSVLGASLGGVLVAIFDPYVPMVLTMLAWLSAMFLVRGIRRPFQSERNGTSSSRTWSAIGEGMRFIVRRPRVLAFVTVKSAVGLGNGALTVYPLLAVSFGVGAAGTGLLFATRGVGILIGPLLLTRMMANDGWLLPALALSMAAFGLSYVGASVMVWFPLVLLFVLIAHVAAGSNWAMSSYAIQAAVPDDLRARVVAADTMLSAMAVSFSQLAVGLLLDTVHFRVLMAACGVTSVLYAIGWWAWARRPARRR